jgi:hypothetical protein
MFRLVFGNTTGGVMLLKIEIHQTLYICTIHFMEINQL